MKSHFDLIVLVLPFTFYFQRVSASPAGNHPDNRHQQYPGLYVDRNELPHLPEFYVPNQSYQDLSSHPPFASQLSFQQAPYDYSLLSQFHHGQLGSSNEHLHQTYASHETYPSANDHNTQIHYNAMGGPTFEPSPSYQHQELPTHHDEQNRVVRSPPNEENPVYRPYRVSQFRWQWKFDIGQLKLLYGRMHDAWGESSHETIQKAFSKINDKFEEHPNIADAIIKGDPVQVQDMALFSKPSLSHKKQRIPPSRPWSKGRFLDWVFDSTIDSTGHKVSSFGLPKVVSEKSGGDRRLCSWLPSFYGREEQNQIFNVLKSANKIGKNSIYAYLRLVRTSTIQSFLPRILSPDKKVAENAAKKLWEKAKKKRRMNNTGNVEPDIEVSSSETEQGEDQDLQGQDTLFDFPSPPQDFYYSGPNPQYSSYYGHNRDS